MKKSKKVLLLLISILLLTGCTKQLKDSKGKVVVDETTKQTLVENVLCKPSQLADTYKKTIEQKKIDYKKMYDDGDISKKEYNKRINNM